MQRYERDRRVARHEEQGVRVGRERQSRVRQDGRGEQGEDGNFRPVPATKTAMRWSATATCNDRFNQHDARKIPNSDCSLDASRNHDFSITKLDDIEDGDCACQASVRDRRQRVAE